MHLVIVNLAYDATVHTPAHLLDHYVQLCGWAEGVAQTGATVTVYQRFGQDAVLDRAGVRYQFMADGFGPYLRMGQLPWRLVRAVAGLCRSAVRRNEQPVIHVNGLLFPVPTALLRAMAPSSVPCVVQHHAEQPRRAARQLLARVCLRQVDGFLFTNHTLAAAWLACGIIPDAARVYAVMECSSGLTPVEPAEGRRMTGMVGDPVLFWAGNLKPQKDPATVLAGFAQFRQEFTDARLYMAYKEPDLLAQVQERIQSHPGLESGVALLGHIPYTEISPYYSSADLFVQGSLFGEGSGIALLDALACGVPPVVPDLPAFRTVTADGRWGALWPPGDVDAFVVALRTTWQSASPTRRQDIRQFFADQWSFPAIGRRATTIYTALLAQRCGTKA